MWRTSNRLRWHVIARHYDLCRVKTYFIDREHINKYSQTPIKLQVHLPPAKVLKEKFRIRHHFRTSPPSTYNNKFRIIISGAVSEIERGWNTAYEFPLSLLVRLTEISLLRSSKCSHVSLVYSTSGHIKKAHMVYINDTKYQFCL